VGRVDLSAGTWSVVSDPNSCLTSLAGATNLSRIPPGAGALAERYASRGQCGGS
jgi:hypothetical protein